MPEILVCEEHSQVYDVWTERGQRDLAVTHVDFHCDLSGLYLDRRRGEAHFVDGTVVGRDRPHSGNYLAHAVMEGRVRSLRWVHDPHGGRRYDTGTVKFESDLSALRIRRRARREQPTTARIEFQELAFDEWDGLHPGEHLDIDWDGLASIDYADDHIDDLTAAFLTRDLGTVPETTYLAYSPGYSNPDLDRFEAFIDALSAKFGATVVRLPDPPRRPGYPLPPQQVRGVAALKQRAALAAHRMGVH